MLVKVEIYREGKFWCARGLGEDIFTQGKTLDETMKNIKEAVELHLEDRIGKGEPVTILTLTETEVGPLAKASSR